MVFPFWNIFFCFGDIYIFNNKVYYRLSHNVVT